MRAFGKFTRCEIRKLQLDLTERSLGPFLVTVARIHLLGSYGNLEVRPWISSFGPFLVTVAPAPLLGTYVNFKSPP